MNEIPIINLGLDFMKEVLREVYPEGHEIARQANIKFYAGVRWGRDFRLNELPREEDGSLKMFPDSREGFQSYISWLADYLYYVDIDPSAIQREFCLSLSQMEPNEAVHLVGKNAGVYMAAIFCGLFEKVPHNARIIEMEDKQRAELWPEGQKEGADDGWRIPLSIILQNVPDKAGRVELLNLYYDIFDNYIQK